MSQSLDPVKLQMAKRKASNDDSRFKNIRDRYHVGGGPGHHLPNTQNLMAPFLDQSLDTAVQGAQNSNQRKQPQSKEKSRQDPASALNGDQSRPKTSTGMRGNGLFRGTDDGPSAAHSILPPK